VKTTRKILLLSAVAVSILYVTGYFIVVQKRLRNPFLSWQGKPLPMAEYYSPTGLKALYEPVVRLDQQVFPKRWQWESSKAFQRVLTNNLDLQWIHKEALRRRVVDAVPDGTAGPDKLR